MVTPFSRSVGWSLLESRNLGERWSVPRPPLRGRRHPRSSSRPRGLPPRTPGSALVSSAGSGGLLESIHVDWSIGAGWISTRQDPDDPLGGFGVPTQRG